MSRNGVCTGSHGVPLRTALLWSIAASCVVTPAVAVTTLTVDLSATLGPATHAASGSLYGVTETLPADVNGLIAPLHPRMFTNPAANVQQPVGDAIVVAGRLAPTGATVTIRLSDWLKGFYTFTSMTDWLDKVGQTVSRRKAAGLTNIYGYEIWNEPGGTWSSSNPISFNDFWKQTYALLRQQDPGIKIIGPSYAYYNESYLSSFLSFCKTNGCVPDIISWHELGGGDLTWNINAYRALEKQLGVGPLPISINEYSGPAHLDAEGQPGASAPIIAKFERARVDSACISYWDVAHSGRLGSLLASNTEPNGGWWFYKWYGEMTGSMVSVTPPTPTNAAALDGFANVDATAASASVLFGGTNDGTIQVVIKGFQSAAYLGSPVHVVVERTPFVNRTTVVKATTTLSTADLAVANNQITVSVTGANATDGYRVSLKSTGTGTGGTGGAGGTSAAGGSTVSSGGGISAGGSKASGGTQSNGGSKASGGTPSAGGSPTTGGSGTTGGSKASGGSSGPSNTGGMAASGGTSQMSGGSSGVGARGGAIRAGGASAGGRATTGGNGIGGMLGTGNVTGTMGGSSSGGLGATDGIGNSADEGSCGCRLVGARMSSMPLTDIGLLGLLVFPRLRRRRQR